MLGLGLVAGRRGEKILKGYGGREIAAGLSLLQAPAHAPRMWNRVVGDALVTRALSKTPDPSLGKVAAAA